MRIIHLLAALLLCAAPAAAQEVLRPGSGQVHGEQIPERRDRFEMWDAGAPEPMGELSLTTRVGTVDGREVIARKEMTRVGGDLVRSDSFAVERRTLAPLYVRESGEVQTVWLTFAPSAVEIVIEADWGTDSIRASLEAPAFVAGTTDLLLGALPLAEGYTAQASVFSWQVESAVTLAITVEGDEMLRLPDGGRVRTWRVAVNGDGSAGTYWMDRESHTLVQYQTADGEMRIVRSRGPRSRAREVR